jgi:hypothetical protein
MEASDQIHAPAALPLGKARALVGPRAILDAMDWFIHSGYCIGDILCH